LGGAQGAGQVEGFFGGQGPGEQKPGTLQIDEREREHFFRPSFPVPPFRRCRGPKTRMSCGAALPHALPDSPKLIVGIGASAGGLNAFTALFDRLPPDTGCAFVVVQHLSPNTESLLDELLIRHTSMPVHRAENTTVLRPNHVYVIPPNRLMTISGGQLALTDRPPRHGGERSIDLFLNSLGVDAGPRAVAVILSGTGSDGTEGARAVHRAGGLVLAQTPATAEHPSMPAAAIASGVVDEVLDPAGIAASIADHTRESAPTGDDQAHYRRIFDLLRSDKGVDFGHYKPPTIRRRVARRMVVRQTPTVDAYAALLARDPDEIAQLGNDLLIGVTDFFRDPAAFAALGLQVLGPLLREQGRSELRVWSVGCATGEEAYSLAILIHEQAEACDFKGQISIFATDVNRAALRDAAAGLFTPAQVGHLSPERIARYFHPEKDGRLRIVPEIRQRIVFAPHNVTNDPPFTRMDLISCRNLLIYFDPATQERVTALFHYALRPGGVLFLGSSESLGGTESSFVAVDSKLKIYRKVAESRLPALMPPVPGLHGRLTADVALPALVTPAITLERQLLRAYDRLFERHLAPGLILAADFTILHYLGGVARYLLPSAGRATDNLLDRVEGEMRLAISTAVARALTAIDVVVLPRVRAGGEAAGEVVDLHAAILPDAASSSPLVHLSFVAGAPQSQPAAGSGADEPFSIAHALKERNLHLEIEIQMLQQRLQVMIEELQTSNEELRSTNEELTSSNEELQSTNEELHSVNEELNTVNSGLAQKSEELQAVADDLSNLLASTEVGTVFLDRELRIRRFNPAISRVFNLLPGDIGRPLKHIAYQLDGQREMLATVRDVLARGVPLERDVRMRDGCWMLRRVLPFYANNRTIQGVVLTFTDVTDIKAMQTRFDLAIESSRLVWWEWELGSDRFEVHPSGPCILGYAPSALPDTGEGWRALVYPNDLPRVLRTLESCRLGTVAQWDAEFRLKKLDGGWHWVSTSGRVTERDGQGKALAMLGTTHDIDQLKRSSDALARDATFLAHVDDAILCFDPQGAYTYWNKGAELIFGWRSAELVGTEPPPAPVAPPRFEPHLEAALHGRNFNGEIEARRRDGTPVWIDVQIYALHDERQVIIGCMVVASDVTERRHEAEQHARIEAQLQQSQKMETLGTLAGGIAHDFNNLLLIVLGYTEAITEMLPPDDPVLAKLDHVRRAGQRASLLVQRILTFSRKREVARQPVVLAQLVRDSLPLLRASLYPTIEIQTHIATENRMVMADPTQLHQVLLNLYGNAGQAMSNKHGRLDVDVAAVTIDTPPPTVVGTVTPGNYLRITISDNGSGMSAATAARVFEPFFTTKRIGEGTGLGLSIVHGIILSHSGAVQLSTQPGKGTVISILLPELTGQGVEAASPPPPPRHGAGERVAVIDDEESVAALTKHALEQRGFHARAFTTISTFLEHLKAHPDEVDLVVTDQAMPAMTGSALAEHLRRMGLRMPVLIISGFARTLSADDLRRLAPADFLGKPFTFDQLAHAVTQLIDLPK